MKLRRRGFMVAGSLALLGAGGGTLWLAFSSSRFARLARQLMGDTWRAPEPPRFKPAPANWSCSEITACWIGHATVLVGFYGLNVITDPVFCSSVGIDFGVGTVRPKRYVLPALDLQELPRIDLILISHAHMEHLDLRSLAGFSSSTPTVTASNTSDLCRRAGLRNVTELHWGEITLAKTPAGEVVVEAFEVKHWGRRWPDKFDRGYNGYLLRRGGRSLLFAGDTAYTSSFAQLRSRGPFEIGFMPIGAYDPWIRNHCTPEQAVQMADMAGVIRIVPIHHGTFKLSDEPMEEPLRRFEQALADQPERIGLRYVGESIALGNADSVRKEASPRG